MSYESVSFILDDHVCRCHPAAAEFVKDHWDSFFSAALKRAFPSREETKSVAIGELSPEAAIYKVSPEACFHQSRLGPREAIRQINDLTIKNPDKTLVLCCRSFNFNHIRLVSTLKKRGFTLILITFSSLMNGSLPVSKAGSLFDYIYFPADYRAYLTVLRNIGPTYFHYIGHMFHYDDALLARLYCHAPFIYEFCDITSTAFDRDSYGRLRSTEEAEVEFWCERYLCENADGIIYQDSDDSMRFLQEKYAISAPTIQFQSYAVREDIPQEKETQTGHDGPVRLVYAGGVHGNQDPKNDGYYLTRSLLRIIPLLTAQGFQFDIYNCYDESGQGFEEFYALRDREPLFTYHRPVLVDELPERLARYDYGWYGLDFSQTVASDQFYRECFGSKFWAYIEAGLPIIMSKEHEYMAGLTAQYGIGIPFCMGDVKDVKSRLEQYDYPNLKENVRKARAIFSMENQIDRLLKFYEKARLHAQAMEKMTHWTALEDSTG